MMIMKYGGKETKKPVITGNKKEGFLCTSIY